jgi:hypothetical protein
MTADRPDSAGQASPAQADQPATPGGQAPYPPAAYPPAAYPPGAYPPSPYPPAYPAPAARSRKPLLIGLGVVALVVAIGLVGVAAWGLGVFGGHGASANSATAIAVGGYHTCALMSGGTIECWGSNSSGRLGNGTRTSSSRPVQVSGIGV